MRDICESNVPITRLINCESTVNRLWDHYYQLHSFASTTIAISNSSDCDRPHFSFIQIETFALSFIYPKRPSQSWNQNLDTQLQNYSLRSVLSFTFVAIRIPKATPSFQSCIFHFLFQTISQFWLFCLSIKTNYVIHRFHELPIIKKSTTSMSIPSQTPNSISMKPFQI